MIGSGIINEVRGWRTLEEVMRWAFGRTPPARLHEVVTQDEYTHDIVIEVEGKAFLVFDTN